MKRNHKLSFKERVLAVVRKIPKGSVLTYQEVARRSGSPRAFRALGNILHKNFDPHIPCHRVIRSDGQLGAYNRGGIIEKKRILSGEGYSVSADPPYRAVMH